MKILKFAEKDSEIIPYLFCWGGNFKGFFSQWYEQNTDLNGKVYSFFGSYETISVSDIKDIHKYLMKNKIL